MFYYSLGLKISRFLECVLVFDETVTTFSFLCWPLILKTLVGHCGAKNRHKPKQCVFVYFFLFRPCTFFLVTFFTPNQCGRAEKKTSKEKKRTGSVFQSTWPTTTHLTHCVEQGHPSSFSSSSSSSFFNSLFPNDDRVKQLPVATKVRLFLVNDLS